MLGSILGRIGSNIGQFFGGGILSTIGRYAGNRLGDYLNRKWFQKKVTNRKFVNAKESFHYSKARYGTPIPLIFGRVRIDGQIIWLAPITEKRNCSSFSKYIKRANTKVTNQTTAFEYYASFALALCEGEIIDIERVWHNDEPIDLSKYNFCLYKGDEEQLPDPYMSARSKDPTPAYRGLAYIVFEELPLADFNDIIPNFSFEVTRKANIKKSASVEDLVKSMIMIPGSGEYVYDTLIQQKTRYTPSGEILSQTNINSHNHYNIADSIHSLNQLQMICEKVEWISPVVCWFGNSTDVKDCIIRPAIEFRNEDIFYSEEWRVGKYNRQTAYEINKDEHNNPIYGGSINDASVLRYLEEIRRRNLKIMFYPMFFLDVPNKPWRGRVTGRPEDVPNFFHREHGYNDFVLHYANLVKGRVDAFIIGSELIGLTRITYGKKFPAVDELLNLANQVKQILGKDTLVSYAADWSEYHHTEGGWFNLDPLWASPSIDYIGIDAYFPVTNSLSSAITPEEIAKGWTTGEGYDYCVDQNDPERTRHAIEPRYAWKNLRYWWENTHINPDGSATDWQPRSKKIWFTEYGFPSIDKAPNQPNVFFDPKCIDGGVPRYSSGKIDFSVQRKAIRAFIEYWSTQEYIEQMFLWTWDARPYPAWPHMNIWRDEYLWEKGHWVNNKFGASSLSSIILEISQKCLLDIDHVDVVSIDVPVEGFLLNNKITAHNAIDILRTSYFFDINSFATESISFIKRGHGRELSVNREKCLKINDNSYFEEIEIPLENTLSKINLYFIDKSREYNPCYKYINNEAISYVNKATVNLPIVMTEYEAEKLGALILGNASIEDRIIKFIIPCIDLLIKPSDFVRLLYNDKIYKLRIINVTLVGLKLSITGIVDDRYSYLAIAAPYEKPKMKISAKIEEKIIVLTLPFSLDDSSLPSVAVYYYGNKSANLYAKFSEESNWSKVKTILPCKNIASIISFDQPVEANFYHFDLTSTILIKTEKFDLPVNEIEHFAMIGEELIGFKNIVPVEEGIYRLSALSRGLLGTEKYINSHNGNEYFILIDTGANILPLSERVENQSIDFKCGDAQTSIIYQNKLREPLIIYPTKQELCDNLLHLEWFDRSRNDGNWKFKEEHKNHLFIVIITDFRGREIKRETLERKIIVDLSELDLSAEYNVNIMVNSVGLEYE